MRTNSGKAHGIRVRTAKIEDAEQIAVLSGQLGYPASGAGMRRRLRYLLREHGQAVWVAETGEGTVAGWIHVFVKQLLESEREAELGGLVVGREFRGQGVGRALVERAERWAKARRLKSVYVRSNVVRKEAHIFYPRLGYRIIKTQSAFRKHI